MFNNEMEDFMYNEKLSFDLSILTFLDIHIVIADKVIILIYWLS